MENSSLDINLKDYNKDQKKTISWMISKNIHANIIKFIANKKYSNNKMWALLFAIKNRILPENIKVMANDCFQSQEIYKVIDGINDKIIDENFLKDYDYNLPFNVQFAIYKKSDNLTLEWKEYIINEFPKDLDLHELDFLLGFIQRDSNIEFMYKYVKKIKDFNFVANLLAILDAEIFDDDFIKMIIRENPNYNKTMLIISLKKHVDNNTIKTKLLKLNVRQLYMLNELYENSKAKPIYDYLLDYKCRISNVDEIEIVKDTIDYFLQSKIYNEELIKLIYNPKTSPLKIKMLINVRKAYKNIDIMKFAYIFDLQEEEYLQVIEYAKLKKMSFSKNLKYFKSSFKLKDILKQIDNITVKGLSEDKLFDFVEKIKRTA